jgi:hypothetical protein
MLTTGGFCGQGNQIETPVHPRFVGSLAGFRNAVLDRNPGKRTDCVDTGPADDAASGDAA